MVKKTFEPLGAAAFAASQASRPRRLRSPIAASGAINPIFNPE
jgi:hypothetical protein